MHISDPHAADRDVKQIDSPTSSADENDAFASLPAHWSTIRPHGEPMQYDSD